MLFDGQFGWDLLAWLVCPSYPVVHGGYGTLERTMHSGYFGVVAHMYSYVAHDGLASASPHHPPLWSRTLDVPVKGWA